MGCGVSKIDNREEEEMEDDSMYVYYNLLPHRPEAEDRLVDCRQKAVADPSFVGPDLKGGDKDNNVVNGVPEPNTVSSLSEEEKITTMHPRSPSLRNCHFPGSSGDCADGEIIRMKKLDIIIDGEKDEDNNVETCTEIILSPHHPLREFACKNLRNKQLPRSLSLKKNRRKWRRFTMSPGLRSCSGSVKNLVIDDTASRYTSPTRRSCSHSSDIHVKYYSLQV